MSKRGSCVDCVFYVVAWGLDERGECHRYPRGERSWPLVHEADWCGEYQARPQQAPPLEPAPPGDSSSQPTPGDAQDMRLAMIEIDGEQP